jgi:hypothetical protein
MSYHIPRGMDQADAVAIALQDDEKVESLKRQLVAAGKAIPQLKQPPDVVHDVEAHIDAQQGNIAILKATLRAEATLPSPGNIQQSVATQQTTAPSVAVNATKEKESQMKEALSITEICLQRKGKPLPTRAGRTLSETELCRAAIAAKGERPQAGERQQGESETDHARRVKRERGQKK